MLLKSIAASVPIPAVIAAETLLRFALDTVSEPPVVFELTSLTPVLVSLLVATNDVKSSLVPAVVMVAVPAKSATELIDTSVLLVVLGVVFSKNDKSI